jgi:hypothetical protein
MTEVGVIATGRFEEFEAGFWFVLERGVEELVHSPPSFLGHGVAQVSHTR